MTQHTSDILNRAADLIEQQGWTAGSDGWPGIGKSRSLCLEGGIIAAQHFASSQYFTEREARLLSCPAYRAVMDYLGTDQRWNSVRLPFGERRAYEWNDAEGRTAAEVIEVLRATAAIEQARESEPVAAQVTA